MTPSREAIVAAFFRDVRSRRDLAEAVTLLEPTVGANQLASEDSVTIERSLRYSAMVDAPLAMLLALALGSLVATASATAPERPRDCPGVRLVRQSMGAQSWQEGLSVYPDFGIWLWTVSLLVFSSMSPDECTCSTATAVVSRAEPFHKR